MQLAAGFVIAELAAIHVQEMTCGTKGTLDTGEIRGEREGVGEREFGDEVVLGSGLAGAVKFTLQVLLGDLDVAQGHANIFVAQQEHESGKTDA